MVAHYYDAVAHLFYLVTLVLPLVSSTIFVSLLCSDKNVSRFEDDDPDSAAMKAKRAAREKKRKEQQEERKRLKEGLQRGEFRPADNNETVNEVVSNWGAAAAMAAARGDQKYLGGPAQGGSESSSKKKRPPSSPPQKFRPANDAETVNEVVSNWGAAQAMLQKRQGVPIPNAQESGKERRDAFPPRPAPSPAVKQKFRPANDAETVNEVVSNWGAAQAMLQKRQGLPSPNAQESGKERKDAFPPRPAASPAVKQMFRPANDAETVNEVVSNWGAAQAMLQKREGGAQTPAGLPKTPAKAVTPGRGAGPQKFRPADDNETVNEVVSNWGAAQAMLQKRAGGMPKTPGTPAKPPARPATTPQKFRPADDNETVNEVVSNWGAAQAMLQKRIAAKATPPKPKPAAPGVGRGVRRANDFETIDECVSNWGAVQALAKKKGE